MTTPMMKILLALSLLAPACTASDAAPAPPAKTSATKLTIKLTTVYVDDQAKALKFYTDVLGFVKKDDFTKGTFRWLTVVSPAEPNGAQLQLALDDNPAAKAFQKAQLEHGQPAVMFFTDDIQAEYERMKARGAEFTMPPTAVTGSKIAQVKDTCGNLVQITQLVR